MVQGVVHRAVQECSIKSENCHDDQQTSLGEAASRRRRSVSQPFVERGTLEKLYLFLRNPLALKNDIFNFSSKYQHHATFIASKYNIPPPMTVLPHLKIC